MYPGAGEMLIDETLSLLMKNFKEEGALLMDR